MEKNYLTRESFGKYAEGLKLVNAAFAPRQSVFFMPDGRMIAENILNIGRAFVNSFSESARFLNLKGLSKKVNEMTNTIIKQIFQLRANLDMLYAETDSQYLAQRCSDMRKELATLVVEILDEEATNCINQSAAE